MVEFFALISESRHYTDPCYYQPNFVDSNLHKDQQILEESNQTQTGPQSSDQGENNINHKSSTKGIIFKIFEYCKKFFMELWHQLDSTQNFGTAAEDNNSSDKIQNVGENTKFFKSDEEQ